MTDFKGIRGWKVQTLSTDPAASLQATGSWASGGNIPANKDGTAGGGSMTAAIVFGGNDTFTDDNSTYEYNGSAWTAGGNMSEGIGYGGGTGSQTSAIAMGGYDSGGSVNTSEEYDGSSWTAGGNMNIEKYNMGTGVIGQANTDASVIGGRDGPANSDSAKQENYNGTAWTEIGDLPAASYVGQATGTTTAAIYFGGTGFSGTGADWNGSAWTTNSATLNINRSSGALSGSSTDALIYSGATPGTDTEYYNGTTWTKVGDLANAAPGKQGRVTQTTDSTAALAYGGYPGPTGSTRTEEWTITATSFQKLNLGQVYFNSTANAFKVTEQPVPGGTWSSGGNLNTARAVAGASSGSDGNTSLFIISGGTPNSVNVEEYDGSAFTEIANVNNAGENGMSSGNGSTVATIFTGGNAPRAALTESWNGSSWTEVNDLNTGRGQAAGIGTQTAALVAGQAYGAIVESWDGTSWTEVSDLNTGRGNLAGMGSQTLAITAGGRSSSSPAIMGNVETWNGSSWTETTDLNTARAETSGSGVPYNNVIVIGGEPSKANTEFWNGSTWTEVGDMATAGSRISQNMGASANATLAFLQASPSVTTEEWNTPETNKTITVS